MRELEGQSSQTDSSEREEGARPRLIPRSLLRGSSWHRSYTEMKACTGAPHPAQKRGDTRVIPQLRLPRGEFDTPGVYSRAESSEKREWWKFWLPLLADCSF